MEKWHWLFVYILFGFLTILSTFPVAAQTNIPWTVEGRKQRVVELRQQYKTSPTPDTLRVLAMVESVVAADNMTRVSVENANKVLERASKAFPSDYELMAARGSVLTMLANFETLTAKQLRYVKKGTRLMDRALKKDPDNIGARLQRGNNSLNLPPFLSRAHYAKRDFQYLLKKVGDQKGAEFKAMALFKLGLAHHLMKEPKQAKQFWNQAVTLNTAVWSNEAKQQLQLTQQ